MKTLKGILKAVALVVVAFVAFFCLFCEVGDEKMTGSAWLIAFVSTKVFGLVAFAIFAYLTEPAWRTNQE